jgi:hypothetical protein
MIGRVWQCSFLNILIHLFHSMTSNERKKRGKYAFIMPQKCH